MDKEMVGGWGPPQEWMGCPSAIGFGRHGNSGEKGAIWLTARTESIIYYFRSNALRILDSVCWGEE